MIVLTQYFLFFQKNFSKILPFLLLVTIFIYKVITNTFFLRNSDIFLLLHIRALLKILNLIMHWIFGLITSHLKCFTYSEEVFWLWCDFYFSLSSPPPLSLSPLATYYFPKFDDDFIALNMCCSVLFFHLILLPLS